MTLDAESHRRASLEGWEEAAPGWVRRQALLREVGEPVSRWMLAAAAPRAGERVLELAAGLGETGMLAAELVGPGGSVVISDQAEGMLAGARERAGELGLGNVEFQALNAEWIDLPVASVDVVLCRWGYMLMTDPATALSETRRVLRPGGRLALAVWDALERNPWASLPAREIAERGPGSPAGRGEARRGRGSDPQDEGPGPFALADEQIVRELLEGAGLADVVVETLDLVRTHRSFDELWETTLDLSRRFHDAVLGRPEGEIEEIKRSLETRFEPYAADDGSLAIPARTLVASAAA